MNQFFVLMFLIIGSLITQIASAQTEPTPELVGPQPFDFEIHTEQPVYHYAYYQGGHEKIRILAKIPQVIPNEKIEIKSVYSRGPHSFADIYSVCSDSTVINCFSKLEGDIYFLDSDRQYGNLFGKWVLDAMYTGQRSVTVFELTTLNTFEIDAVRQKYTIKDLKNIGLELVFLGSEISNQTTLKLEIFKMNENGQDLVFEHNVDVEISAEPPYFNRLPITFPDKVPFVIGKYNITASWGDLFDSDTFEIVELPPVVTEPQQDNNDGCLIATAAFGSELAPPVQMLREFRETRILSTTSGTSFLKVFNAWYYSFSPTIADVERESLLLQTIIKNSLYPLIGILQVSQAAAVIEGETGIILTGFVASTLIGTVYMWPLSLRLDFTRIYKQIILAILASLGLVAYGITFGNVTILMGSTTIFVLTSVTLGATLSGKILNLIRTKNKKRTN
ncbi:MAG: CFI-box-CTERM domain-containing protein [Nitrosopumilaceae archaeon]